MYPTIILLAFFVTASGLVFIGINDAVPMKIRIFSCVVGLALGYLGNAILKDLEENDDPQFPDDGSAAI